MGLLPTPLHCVRTQEAWGCLAFQEGPCRISPVCSQLAIALSKPCALEAGSSEASGPGPGPRTLPMSERYTPRGLTCLSLNHLIPSFPVEQMQREKTQCIIIKYYLTPAQVRGKLISAISPCLQDVDKIGWGGVCESTFTTVRCWTVEELQLWGRCHEGQILSLTGVFLQCLTHGYFPGLNMRRTSQVHLYLGVCCPQIQTFKS